jgi:hypothetical protein
MSDSENNIQVSLNENILKELVDENIQVQPEALIMLKQMIEKEVGEVVEMLLETTAIQGKYTAQDVRQLLSLKGFNICY